jgi:succinate-acetate transporter protein
MSEVGLPDVPLLRVVAVATMLGGVGHIVTGLVVFREQLGAIVRDGFVNAILPAFDRRAAFWFVLFGAMVVMAGHVILHAASHGDAHILRIVGWYLLGAGTTGTLAMTRSPSWGLIVISLTVLWSAYHM